VREIDMAFELALVVRQDADHGGFEGFVPAVPGVVARGETPEECRGNLNRALWDVMAHRQESYVQSGDDVSVMVERYEIAGLRVIEPERLPEG
jgi:predicted RNase H-like HicB family nuclease